MTKDSNDQLDWRGRVLMECPFLVVHSSSVTSLCVSLEEANREVSKLAGYTHPCVYVRWDSLDEGITNNHECCLLDGLSRVSMQGSLKDCCEWMPKFKKRNQHLNIFVKLYPED